MSDIYRVFETEQFQKDLKKLKISKESSRYLKISTHVYDQIKENPFYGKNIKKLIDWKPDTWRYRIGNLRLFYIINKKDRIIFIIAIEPRDKAY